MNQNYERCVGHNLRMLREEAGFTQEALATKLQLCGCDITRSALAKMEVGQRHIYPDELFLLKALLGVTYEQLLEQGECAEFPNAAQ